MHDYKNEKQGRNEKPDKQTSWGNVAEWYDGMLSDADNFQAKVILPNLLRIVEPKEGMLIADVACGQGYFSWTFAKNGAAVIGNDIAPELVALARSRTGKEKVRVTPGFYSSPSTNLSFLKDGEVDVAVIILALQNIKEVDASLAEIARTLKKGGRFVLVLNHPAFRIPKKSSWEWHNDKQFRRIDAYISEDTIKIDMTPGESRDWKKQYTYSFHRPLQFYFKALRKAGFAVTRLEEWQSHKVSQAGPRAAEEDRMRKEIPMFLCLESVKM